MAPPIKVRDLRSEEPPSSGAPDQSGDVWSERWADPALRRLGRWLIARRYSDSQAMHAVSRVWSFYSYAVVPVFRGYPPVIISAVQAEGKTSIWLHLPEPAPSWTINNRSSTDVLQERLARYEQRPVDPTLSLHLEIAGTSDTLETMVSRVNEQSGRIFLGVYHDDLIKELGKVMDPGSVPVWLRTPNESYQDHRPEEFLNDPKQDHLIRDLILEVKHGLVA